MGPLSESLPEVKVDSYVGVATYCPRDGAMTAKVREKEGTTEIACLAVSNVILIWNSIMPGGSYVDEEPLFHEILLGCVDNFRPSFLDFF